MLIDRDKLSSYIDRSYSCSCAHGFHDVDLSIEHQLMLVLTELCEVIDADRRGSRADLESFDASVVDAAVGGMCWRTCFERFVKDTVEDELADVCIRLFDLCGAAGIELFGETYTGSDEWMSAYDAIFGGDTLCEVCYYVSRLLCDADTANFVDDGSDDCMPFTICSVLSIMYGLAGKLGVDLDRHIGLKMLYNDGRPMLNGKRY